MGNGATNTPVAWKAWPKVNRSYLRYVSCMVMLASTACVPYHIEYNDYTRHAKTGKECGGYILDARLREGADRTVRLNISLRSIRYSEVKLFLISAELTYEDGVQMSFLKDEGVLLEGPEEPKSWKIEDQNGQYYLISRNVGALISRYPKQGEVVSLRIAFKVSDHDPECVWVGTFEVNRIDEWTLLSIFTTP